MTFGSPWVLVALLALPLVIALQRVMAHRSRRHALRFTGVATLAGIVPTVNRRRRHIPMALFLAALAALVVALARPERTVGIPVERASVMLVTDVSRSMRANDVRPSRLEAARRAGESFLDNAPPQIQVGSVTFSDKPQIVESPSPDRGEARSVLDGLVADGGTATGDGLQAALDSLDRRPGGSRTPAAILMLSDGQSTIGRNPVGVAAEAGKRNIPIYTVALGTETAVVPGPNGQLLPVPPDPVTLKKIAEVSGGKAFTAQQAEALSDVYKHLGSQIGQRKAKRQVTAGFAGIGAVLLLLAGGAAVRLGGRFA